MWLHVPREALSASAPESEGSISGSPPSEWSLWCTSSGKPSPHPSSWPGWKTRSWVQRLSGTTCVPSTLAHGVAWWISSLAERRARISASPVSALGWMAAGAACSSSTSGSPSSARPPPSSGRTSPEQLPLSLWSANTSRKEATEARGPSFERVTLEPLISAPASSSWPTAGASDGSKGGPNQRGSAGDLMLPSAAVQQTRGQWPTPTVHGNYNRAGLSPTSGDGLHTAATNWPTPSARDWKSGQASQETHDRNSRPLNEVACQRGPLLLTTEPGGNESSPPPPGSLQLNPLFVEWLMGWPLGWTDFAPVGTASYQHKPPTRGGDSGLTSLGLVSVA